MSKIKRVICFIVIVMIFTITGCVRKEEGNDTDHYYTFTDSMGREVNLIEKPERVVSLVGSYAETWLLSGGSLAGVTDDVIHERSMEIPKGTKIVGTIKEPNLEEIINIDPDFVLISPDIESHVRISDTLSKLNIPFAFFRVEQFEDYLNILKICTDITGEKELYEKNGLGVKYYIQDILAKVDKDKNYYVLFMRAFSTGVKAKNDDNFVCRILNDLGTVNIAAKHESLLEDLSIEEIISEDPDFIFVVTMGDSEKAIKALSEGIQKNPVWSKLSAVKNNRYVVLPKELFHYKPNAKWGESYEYIAKILYPEVFE